MIRYDCLKCGAKIESPSKLAGKQDVCPVCGNKETVPNVRAKWVSKRVMMVTVVLATGLITHLVSVAIEPLSLEEEIRGFTAGGHFARYMIPTFFHAAILGGITLVTCLPFKKLRPSSLLVFAYLFAVCGVWDLTMVAYERHVHNELVELTNGEGPKSRLAPRDGTSAVPPRERLLGHWASDDDYTHLYFGSGKLFVVNLGQKKEVMYRIVESSQRERSVRFEVSGADYVPHTRTMYFLDDGSAWQVMETSFGRVKSKFRYVDRKSSP